MQRQATTHYVTLAGLPARQALTSTPGYGSATRQRMQRQTSTHYVTQSPAPGLPAKQTLTRSPGHGRATRLTLTKQMRAPGPATLARLADPARQ